MAFKISAEGQMVFFTKVFGPHDPTVAKAKALVDAGYKFEVTLYDVNLFKGGTSMLGSVTLTVGTTSLMKGLVDPSVVAQNKKLIANWVKMWHDAMTPNPPQTVVTDTAGTTYVQDGAGTVNLTILGWTDPTYKPNFINLIKAVREVTHWGLAAAKDAAEQVLNGKDVVLAVTPAKLHASAGTLEAAGVKVLSLHLTAYPPPVEPAVATVPYPKPTNGVISLKDAKALGQQVHGTSAGSVYHTIALSESGVKLAARLYNGGSISIRAEWSGQPGAIKAELAKLESAGLQMKSNYGSVHFDSAGVQIQRVIGAFLVGSGVKWQAAVINGDDLIIDGDKY